MYNDSGIMDSIKTNFNFLCSDFGAILVKEEIDTSGVFLTYITEKAGVRISFEPREGGLFGMIFPLKNNSIPDYQEWFDLIDLFQAKGENFIEKNISSCEDPDMKELENMIKYYADAVRIYAGDFLRGDFSLIGILEQIVKDRADSI